VYLLGFGIGASRIIKSVEKCLAIQIKDTNQGQPLVNQVGKYRKFCTNGNQSDSQRLYDWLKKKRDFFLSFSQYCGLNSGPHPC
jgi:hypothetical protein